MDVLMVFFIIIIVALMFLLPPFIQIRCGINPEHFKKIKINALSFMFRGIGGKNSIYYSVKDYGVILPMLAIQIMGYVFALVTVALVFVVIFAAQISLPQTVLITAYMLIAEALICAITTGICAVISNKKDKEADGEYKP